MSPWSHPTLTIPTNSPDGTLKHDINIVTIIARRNWYADPNKDIEADNLRNPLWAVAVGNEKKLVYNKKGNIMVKESIDNGIKFYAITGTLKLTVQEINSYLFVGNHRLLAKRERVEAAMQSGNTAERDRHGFAYFRYVS